MDEQNKESLPDFDELIEAEGNDAEAEAVDAPKGKTAVKTRLFRSCTNGLRCLCSPSRR